ncbi:LuxR C-terminal-related transcriptional regulator [Streptomyces sp. ME02-6987-2C]|uniref:LuxR C-terminal-related transcriptional regulator n=1 Tax=unclassified Streptomyces TaxID=2593676 RepID=UPI00087BEF69|nr:MULTISPECIES: LuxR C-terminal-related transcriptional regulator [unclassified Streptomyces]MDX3367426.1 LuxR C-terminal-related transcriptional regulator [Streptomyces sp. ME02-6987-2C]MDX3423758.1 LuxR C-terminal-related transcriptional regulator [Streptomyces sp. ME02-6985-2c]REH20656.1 regulatory LuxR family protein [Streptomyces sp. 2221.1]SDT31463.1 regulatory protein, luxR family [Streptomyces sp. 2114.2]
MTTTLLPTTPLTRAEKDVAALVAAGLGLHTIAARRRLAPSTVKKHLHVLRSKLNCTGAPQHLLVHAILSAGQAPMPAARRHAPDVSPEQARLWRALAAHRLAPDIGQAAGIAPSAVKRYTAHLLTAVGARDLTHLIILGHAWGQLTAGHPAPTHASGSER